MKTVKIKHNVIHKAAILKQDSIQHLPNDEADRLIKDHHAEETNATPAERPPQQDNSPRGILSRMKRPELLAEVENWNKANTDKPPIIVAPNGSNKDIVDALLKAAGYTNQ